MTSGGYIKLFKEDKDAERQFTDAELRLFTWFRCQAGWAPTSPKRFLKITTSIKEIGEDLGWKEGKTGLTLRSLINKRLIERTKKYREFRLTHDFIHHSITEIRQSNNESEVRDLSKTLANKMQIPASPQP